MCAKEETEQKKKTRKPKISKKAEKESKKAVSLTNPLTEHNSGKDTNLIPITNLAKDSQREIRSKGGKACAQKKKERKTLEESVEIAMLKQIEGQPLTYFEQMLINICIKASAAESWAVDYVSKILSRLDHKRATQRKEQQIWKKLLSGGITEKEASYMFEKHGVKLPESVKLQILKQEPEAVDTTAGMFSTFSDEEMETRLAARKQEVEAQRDGLAERRVQMDELHKQAPDTYAESSPK